MLNSKTTRETGKFLLVMAVCIWGTRIVWGFSQPSWISGIVKVPNYSEGVFLCGEGSGTGDVAQVEGNTFHDYQKPRGLLVINKGHQRDNEVLQLVHRASYLCPEKAWWRGFMGIGDHFHLVTRDGEWRGSGNVRVGFEQLDLSQGSLPTHMESCNKDFVVISSI